MHQGKFLYIYKMPFIVKSEIWKKLGILEETKDVTEWVNSFVIMEKKTPVDSSKSPTISSSQEHSKDRKKLTNLPRS